jgi:hypothetical protein
MALQVEVMKLFEEENIDRIMKSTNPIQDKGIAIHVETGPPTIHNRVVGVKSLRKLTLVEIMNCVYRSGTLIVPSL